MAARSIHIKLHNRTNFNLLRTETSVDSGIAKGYAPAFIEANSTVEFGSESNGFMTGTEGWVKFVIQEPKMIKIYFHWSNPYLSDANPLGQHYNRFTEQIGDGYSISHTGDEHSHNMIVDLYIDLSKDINALDFLPSIHGFKFANSWGGFGYKIPVLHGIPIVGDLKLGNASNGLCGGMVYAVRDYFEDRYPIPQKATPVNNEDDPLTQYIINRLLASLDLSDVTMYIKLMNPTYADTDDGLLLQTGQQGRAYITIREEWPMIKRDVDQGLPCPVGLVRVKSFNPGDLGHNHQVMIYGYRLSGNNVILKTYDPNYPKDDNVTITLSLAALDKPVDAKHNKDGKPIYALFKTRYEKRSGYPRTSQSLESVSSRLAITGPFDSMVCLPDTRIFAIFGDQYVCYLDQNASIIPANYPRPIKGNWGKLLPLAFESGFDSMATLPDGKTYITKGNQYIRYSDGSANIIDSSYPRPIKGNWGKDLPSAFESGFDSMATLPDGKTYITKGNQYIRYSDASANSIDASYPRPIKGNWGKELPTAFESGFDSMAALPNGKTYITKGSQYIRYSDASANSLDAGYPKPITGNWGGWFEEPAPNLHRQENWRWCNKCQGLTFAGSESSGNCPSGGKHDHGGSSNYILIQNNPNAQGQSNWQWCNKCQSLAFAGSSSLGNCASGGVHNHQGSGNYTLIQNSPHTQGQSNWQWCNKCQTLSFAGNNSLGPCPAGGEHNHQGSGNYTLYFAVSDGS